MREIVKRETIETSIAAGRSASRWATCVACIRSVCESASVWALGERLEEGGAVLRASLL